MREVARGGARLWDPSDRGGAGSSRIATPDSASRPSRPGGSGLAYSPGLRSCVHGTDPRAALDVVGGTVATVASAAVHRTRASGRASPGHGAIRIVDRRRSPLCWRGSRRAIAPEPVPRGVTALTARNEGNQAPAGRPRPIATSAAGRPPRRGRWSRAMPWSSAALRENDAHVCADCVEACEGLFRRRERKQAAGRQAPHPSPARRPPRRLHHRPGPGEADARRRRHQPLQAGLGLLEADRGPRAQGRRGRQEQRPADRPDRLRQDGPGADPRPTAQRPLRHRRRNHPDRGRLRRRGRREPDPQARPRGRLRRPARRARDHLHRRDRQDRQDQPERLDHPRRLRRGRPAGAPEDARRDRRQRPAPGRPEAPRAGIPPGRHQPDPLHLRRDVRRAWRRSSASGWAAS